MDLLRVVAAPPDGADVLVRQALGQPHQALVAAEEVLPLVLAGGDGVLLVLAVHQLAHAAGDEPLRVAGQQRVPVGAPDHLDHVPLGAAEDGLQLLDDLGVAAHRAVEALQVAVDDEDEVVEALARGQGDRPQGLGLVHLAVAEEGPDLGAAGLLEAAVLEVAVVARLVDRHDRRQAHGCGGKRPEPRHQPRVGVGGQAAAGPQLVAEVEELPLAQAALQEGAGVDAGRGVGLEEDVVALEALGPPPQEVVEGDLHQGRRRGVGGDVAAHGRVFLVGPDHHDGGVPAQQLAQPLLQAVVARVGRLLAPAGWC